MTEENDVYEEIWMKESLKKDSPEADDIEVDDNEAYVCVTTPPIPTETIAKQNGDQANMVSKKLLNELDKEKEEKSTMTNYNKLQILVAMVIAIILVVIIACIIAAFIEISRIKSKEFDQPSMLSNLLNNEHVVNVDQINGSVQDLLAKHTQLENRINLLEESSQMLVDILNQFPLGLSQSSPALSCAAIQEFLPASPSGFYWVRSSNGSGIYVYCDMTRTCGNITGGWMRVTDLNLTESDTVCPPGFSLSNESGLRTCRASTFSPECTSLNYSLHGVSYSHACGMIRAYQVGSIEAFERHAQQNRPANATIDSNYVDGISLTYGANPRQHIWTFAASCPCDENRPQFINSDYFCDGDGSGIDRVCFSFCPDVILWDGMSCLAQSSPWFYRNFVRSTSDDIELRVCYDEGPPDEDIAIEVIELYVQ